MNNPLRKPEHRGSGFSIRGLAQQIRDLIDWGRTLTDRVNYLSRLAGTGQITISWLPGGPVVRAGTLRSATLVGKADADIPARTGDTPGSGTVSLWKFDGTDWVDADREETAYNLASSDVTADTFLILVRETESGVLLVDFEDCG